MHPLAWWAWALGVAVAVTRTANPWVTGLLGAATVTVVLARRQATPWARSFGGYLGLAAAVVALRLVFHVLVGIKPPGPVLLDLPRVALPSWAVGVELFGPITLAGLLPALWEGMRLAALVVCFGAANALANPRRALRSMPSALHPLSSAVVIAVSVTPQLVRSAQEVHRAQRLRGEDRRGPARLPALVVPVLTDALDRSLALAASMDSRGYARAVPGSSDRRVGALLLVALVAAVLGTYGLLDGTAPAWLGVPVLAAGVVATVVAGAVAGRRVHRTRYRPDGWGAQETLVAGCGAGAAVVVLLAAAGLGGAAQHGGPPLVVALGAAVAAVPALLREETS